MTTSTLLASLQAVISQAMAAEAAQNASTGSQAAKPAQSLPAAPSPLQPLWANAEHTSAYITAAFISDTAGADGTYTIDGYVSEPTVDPVTGAVTGWTRKSGILRTHRTFNSELDKKRWTAQFIEARDASPNKMVCVPVNSTQPMAWKPFTPTPRTDGNEVFNA